jgi:hypothetical protein
MARLQEGENIEQFVNTSPRIRAEEALAARARLDARGDADAARAERFTGRQSLPEIEALLMEAGAAEAASGADNARSALGLNAIRSGSGGEQAIAQIARNAIADRRSAIANARLNAGSEFLNRRNAQRGANEDAQAGALRRASGTPTLRAGGGDLAALRLSAPAQAELASRIQPVRGGTAQMVEAPRIGYADDRSAMAIGGLGRGIDNFFTELGRFAGPTSGTKVPQSTPRYGGLF